MDEPLRYCKIVFQSGEFDFKTEAWLAADFQLERVDFFRNDVANAVASLEFIGKLDAVAGE